MAELMLRFTADETGATAIEYGLIAGLVAAGIIAAVSNLGAGARTLYEAMANAAANAPKP